MTDILSAIDDAVEAWALQAGRTNRLRRIHKAYRQRQLSRRKRNR